MHNTTQFDCLYNADKTKIHTIQLYDESGEMSMKFTAVDVGYTICQKYREAAIGPSVFITSKFPEKCISFQLEEVEDEIAPKLLELNVDLYFDADGQFVFRGETENNPKRAIAEFIELYRTDRVILAPSLTIFETDAEHVHVHRGFGNKKIIYFYT